MFKVTVLEAVEGWIFAKMYDCGRFPMIIEHSDKKVYGLVLKFKNLDELLPTIDNYERCNVENNEDALYVRKKVVVHLNTDERITAWTYFGNNASHFCKQNCIEKNFIRSGRWKIRTNLTEDTP
jgi:gamma-glutamylcyclotransferase (GGCT)/AIG2-like uncharacterized protein YtfP